LNSVVSEDEFAVDEHAGAFIDAFMHNVALLVGDRPDRPEVIDRVRLRLIRALVQNPASGQDAWRSLYAAIRLIVADPRAADAAALAFLNAFLHQNHDLDG
jgi:hypothetical protein